MLDWQTGVALSVVLMAFLGLTWRGVQWWRQGGQSGCGSCPSRGAGEGHVKQLPLAQLELPPRDPKP